MKRTTAIFTLTCVVAIAGEMIISAVLNAQQDPMHAKVIDAVKRKQASATDFSILNSIPEFFDGTLYTVGFVGADGNKKEHYVHVSSANVTSDTMPVYANIYELLVSITRLHPPKSFPERFFERTLQVGGISAVIALLLTVVICINAVRGQPIPDILSNALTVILGFYFGTVVPKP